MKNFLIVKDGFEKILQADLINFNSETGQTMLFNQEKNHVVAIIPKEAFVIETEQLTDYQKNIREIIDSLQSNLHNDFERELLEFNTLDMWKDTFRKEWLGYFTELYEKTL